MNIKTYKSRPAPEAETPHRKCDGCGKCCCGKDEAQNGVTHPERPVLQVAPESEPSQAAQHTS